MKTPHTVTARGRLVRVTLKTGETFVDRFLERTAKKVILFASGRRVAAGEIRSFSDRKPQQLISKERRIS